MEMGQESGLIVALDVCGGKEKVYLRGCVRRTVRGLVQHVLWAMCTPRGSMPVKFR